MSFSGQSTERTRPCCLRPPPPGEPGGDCRPDAGGRLPDLRHRSWRPGLPVTRLRCLRGARSVSRSRCRPDPVGRLPDLRCRRPPTRLSTDVDPVAGAGTPVCRLPGPVGPTDAVHADPVTRAIAVAPLEPAPHGQLGCPCGVGPAPRPFLHVGCPSGGRVEAGGFSPRSELAAPRWPGSFPSTPIRRSDSDGSVSRPRSACAARYGRHSREREIPGQEVFSYPQAYPLKFPPIPRISWVVHLACTGRPGVFPTVFHHRAREARMKDRCGARNDVERGRTTSLTSGRRRG
jgi:hypothetical protein